jgi:spore coat protein CotH
MIKTYFIFIFFGLVAISSSLAQSTSVNNSENFFGIDRQNQIIVCHQSLIDSLVSNKKEWNTLLLGNTEFSFVNPAAKLVSTDPYLVVNTTDTFQLFVTPLPILKINAKDSIVNEPKINARLAYADSITQFSADIAIELRGNSALKYPKKSYDLELRKDSLTSVSIAFSMGGLREDDDWILNSLYNEPLKLRSYFATKLWLDVRSSNALDEKANGKSSNDLVYAEVFLNGSYEGLYLLSEQVDRKQLQLKKIQGDTVHGELFKANSYANASTFKSAPSFNNALPHWAGFEMKYPYENFEAHWENVYKFIALASADDDEKFTAKIEKQLDLDNAIDYFLFVNLLRATDNLGKNYYLARESQKTPYYFVPWDLDGIMGYIQDAKRIETTGDVLSNPLFDRLLATNPANYRSRLKARWEELRTGVYSDEALFGRLNEVYSFLQNQKIYERDQLRWPGVSDSEAELAYLKNWLEKRLRFLDRLCAGFD